MVKNELEVFTRYLRSYKVKTEMASGWRERIRAGRRAGMASEEIE